MFFHAYTQIYTVDRIMGLLNKTICYVAESAGEPKKKRQRTSEQNAYHKCRNCRVVSKSILCDGCRRLPMCRHCGRHLQPHSFDSPDSAEFTACTKRRNRQTRSALYDVVSATTLDGQYDPTPVAFLQRNEGEILELVRDSMRRHR